MTFLALPFLFAALAAAIPVVLHMINRQKAKDLPFSTLRFLRVSVQRTRRRKRVHDLALMLVRMASLVLIAFALARPTLTGLRSLWGSNSTTAVAIILDNSASMGMMDQGRVRFRTALHAAEQILDQLHEGDPVALYISSGRPLPEQGKLDRTHETVHQILRLWMDAPSPTDGVSFERADLGSLVQRARKTLSECDAANKQIYVLTDLQAIDWETLRSGVPRETADQEAGTKTQSDAAQGPKSGSAKKGEDSLASRVQQQDATDGPDIPIVLVDCHRAPKPNVAVQDVSVEASVPVAGLPVRATVELLNTSSVLQQPHVELYIDGKKEDMSPALSVLPEGRVKHDFQFTFKSSGLHRGEVRLSSEDGSALDDRRFFTMEVDQGIPVAIVKAQRHEIPYLEDTFYVEQALSPGKSGDWAIRPTVMTAGDLLSEPLGNYRVVFCVNLPAPSGDVAEKLRAYVLGGGNLVWIGGDHVEAQAYNEMNQQAGGQLLPLPLLGLHTVEPGQGRDSWSIGFADKKHPALTQLCEPETLFRSVLVYKYLRMDLAEAGNVWVLARLDDTSETAQGEPLLVQRSVDKGRVLMLGTSVHVGWSNLPVRPVFLPLLVRLTFYLAGMEQMRHQVLAGRPLAMPLEGAGAVGVEVVLPDGEVTRLTTTQQAAVTPEFRFHDTHQVGVYVLRAQTGTRPLQVAFAVNMDPDEANPAKIPVEELQELLAPAPLLLAENADDSTGTFALLRQGKSLWEMLLTAVLVVLVFETFLSNRLSLKQDMAEGLALATGPRRRGRRGVGR